jgi:hypothetical protein
MCLTQGHRTWGERVRHCVDRTFGRAEQALGAASASCGGRIRFSIIEGDNLYCLWAGGRRPSWSVACMKMLVCLTNTLFCKSLAPVRRQSIPASQPAGLYITQYAMGTQAAVEWPHNWTELTECDPKHNPRHAACVETAC